MPDIPFAQILILIAFILFPLINLLLRRMQTRAGSQTPRDEPPRRETPRQRTISAAPEVIILPSERTRAPDLRETLPPPRSGRSGKRSLFRNRRDLRRAIILMTVLGPCRAADSTDAERQSIKQ
jgi:hypothetical protein